MWRIISEPKDKMYTFYDGEGKGQNEAVIRFHAGDIVTPEQIKVYKIPTSLIEKDE